MKWSRSKQNSEYFSWSKFLGQTSDTRDVFPFFLNVSKRDKGKKTIIVYKYFYYVPSLIYPLYNLNTSKG